MPIAAAVDAREQLAAAAMPARAPGVPGSAPVTRSPGGSLRVAQLGVGRVAEGRARSRPRDWPPCRSASTRRARSIRDRVVDVLQRPAVGAGRARRRVDPDQAAVEVHQRAARVARVQRGVGLDDLRVGGHVGRRVAEGGAVARHDAAWSRSTRRRPPRRRRSRARPRSRPARRSAPRPERASSQPARVARPAAARGPRTGRRATTRAARDRPPRRRGTFALVDHVRRR